MNENNKRGMEKDSHGSGNKNKRLKTERIAEIGDPSASSPFSLLSVELLQQIFGHFTFQSSSRSSLHDISSIIRVCKTWRNAIDNWGGFWKRLCLQIYPKEKDITSNQSLLIEPLILPEVCVDTTSISIAAHPFKRIFANMHIRASGECLVNMDQGCSHFSPLNYVLHQSAFLCSEHRDDEEFIDQMEESLLYAQISGSLALRRFFLTNEDLLNIWKLDKAESHSKERDYPETEEEMVMMNSERLHLHNFTLGGVSTANLWAYTLKKYGNEEGFLAKYRQVYSAT